MLHTKTIYKNKDEGIDVQFIERYYSPNGLGAYSSVYVVTSNDLTRVYLSSHGFQYHNEFNFLPYQEWDKILTSIRYHEIKRGLSI